MQKAPEFALFRLQSALRSGIGALEIYKAERFPATQLAAAEGMMVSALEDIGQECVSDYVQSTTNALKRPMFFRRRKLTTR